MNTLISTILTFLVLDLLVMIYAIKVVSRKKDILKATVVTKDLKHVIDYAGMVPIIRPVCHLSVIVNNKEENITTDKNSFYKLQVGNEVYVERCQEEVEKRNSFIMGIFSQKPSYYKETKTYYYIEGAV